MYSCKYMSILSLALISSLVSALPTPQITFSRSPKFSSIVAFGDSFTDNGNGSFRISNGTWPPSYYYQGRFSNGPVWVEDVAQNLSIALYDYAVGGSTSSNKLVVGNTGPNGTIPAPATDEQVDGFLRAVPAGVDIPSALFVVSGGANDVLDQPNVSAYQSRDVLALQVQKLKGAGAQHFFFFNYYDTSEAPVDSFSGVDTKLQFRKWSRDFGRALRDLHASVPGSYYYDLAAELFPNLYYYGQPTTYGFDQFGAYGGCVQGSYKETPNLTICDEPDKKVFWDEYHPSRVTHRLFADGVLSRLAGQ